MKSLYRYVVVDDDPIDIFICHTVLKKQLGDPEFRHFTKAALALEYFKNEFTHNGNEKPAVVFLDINMDVMDGWEFLDHFDKLDEKVKNLISIYIFSSSISTEDHKRALQNKYVADYIVKPLVSDRVEAILADVARVK